MRKLTNWIMLMLFVRLCLVIKMPSFNKLSDLFTHVQKAANSALKNEVAELAVKTMQEHIQEDVYDAYDPVYPEKRRMYNDGLIDPSNIEIQVVSSDSISVEDIAYDGVRNVPYIVESGDGYSFNAPDVLTRGRKFTDNTRQELKSTNKVKNAMINGIKRQNIDSN